jgi:hypothetical protein
MASKDLTIHRAEALRDEYELLHGPFTDDLSAITVDDILEAGLQDLQNPSSALLFRLMEIGWVAGGILTSANIAAFLNGTIGGPIIVVQEESAGANFISNATKLLAKGEEGRPKSAETRRINRLIVEEILPELVRQRVERVYQAIHKLNPPRTALCISGGGIRSATFALGVLQGLSSRGLLSKFDYLSTVSGGGYIGSWLSTWIKRHTSGVAGVQGDLASDGSPEPRPIRHLRDYSNYLVPRLGIFSADSWTVAATYIRNLLLNWLVLVPIIGFVLGLSRGHVWLMQHISPTGCEWLWLAIPAAICAAISFVYLGRSRPVTNRELAGKRWASDGGFVGYCVVPSIVLAFLATVSWAVLTDQRAAAYRYAVAHHLSGGPPREAYSLVEVVWAPIAACIALATVAWCWYAVRSSRSGRELGKLAWEFVACVMSGAGAGVLLAWLATWLFPKPVIEPFDYLAQIPPVRLWIAHPPSTQLYVVFAVPIVLLAFYVQASFFVGLASKVNEDYDREWWARSGGWFILAACAWAVVAAISLFGPIGYYHAPRIIGSVGGISGLVAVLAGKSASTPGNNKQKEKESKTGIFANVSLALAAPLFVVALLAAVSLLTTTIVNAVVTFEDPDEVKHAEYATQFRSWSTGVSPLTPVLEKPKVPVQLLHARSSETPVVDMADYRSWSHLRSVHKYGGATFLLLFGLAVLAYALSWAFGVNRFSMHAFYRNRLIRAYLGASRYRRKPNSFTGFDKHDNIKMWQLHPDYYAATSILNRGEVIKKALTAPWWGKMLNHDEVKRLHATGDDTTAVELLVDGLNDLISGNNGKAVVTRAALDAFFQPFVIPREPKQRLFHVINIALNLVSGKKLAYQERMAESFTVTPLHCGNYELGYRDSCQYGDPDRGISIGTALAISGAAASPNQGYHSSPAVAALLTAFNVRLGWWLGNPGPAGDKVFRDHEPRPAIGTIMREAVGGTDDEYKWVYLSDGGHFENLGLYEMVMRRCRYIFISDAGCDPDFTFEDLGNAIRKIYIDFGIPIEIETTDLLPRDDERKEDEAKNGKYFAYGKIHYGKVDKVDGKDAPDGYFLYIKPSIYGREPRDIYSYARQSATFPHETTADQFFSESQFESYRRLGRYTVEEVLLKKDREKSFPDLKAFFDAAKRSSKSADDFS